MDISLVIDLILKAGLGVLVLVVSYFPGTVFLWMSWFALVPAPGQPAPAYTPWRYIYFLLCLIAGLMFTLPGVVVLYLVGQHMVWLVQGDFEALRIKRP
jgi:hypothetical protein